MVRPSDSHFDYLTVGHVTHDAIEQPASGTIHQPGGSAFYSALQAARLGLSTLIVTQGIPGEIEALLEPYLGELELHVIPADHTTLLSTRGCGAKRSQRVLAWAGPIVDPPELDTEVLHLAPVARETPTAWNGRAALVGVTPQGLIRRWGRDGRVSLVPLDSTALPYHFDAAAIGEQEQESCQALFEAAREQGAPVAVTAGPRPTTVRLPAGGAAAPTAVVPLPDVCDDLGAGDVFAAAFFVALSEGRTPLDAAAFGNAAATVRIAGVGPGAIGNRAQIEAILRGGGYKR
jgi:sugar/nucleoside kinase (ribokinase family)